MNKALPWVVGILILLVVGGFVVFGLSKFLSSPATTATTSPVTTFPNSGTTGSTGGSVKNPSTPIVIGTQGGNNLRVNDFIHNGVTIPDTENPGSYLLSGTLGYCLSNMKCTAGSSSDFNIKYDSSSNSFGIGLLKEPLGQSRTEAEKFLMNALGLNQDQMCSLNYYVGTSYTVNEAYDSGNLGFSFCPGATQLP